MGTYDTIVLAGNRDALLCAHGHEIRELQTKDLGAEMNTYVVFDGSLYRTVGDGIFGRAIQKDTYRLEGELLIVTHEQQGTLATAAEVTAYTSCDACLPVLVERTGGSWDAIDDVHPWVQYVLRFEGSRLMERRPDRLETRDDVRNKHPRAIPDDDRVAVRYFERRSV
jgi:hypothetical protein